MPSARIEHTSLARQLLPCTASWLSMPAAREEATKIAFHWIILVVGRVMTGVESIEFGC